MATIRIHRKHDLDRDRVREEIQQLADELARKLSARYQWHGDRLTFERSGASGHIDFDQSGIDVEIKLGMLLTPLKSQIESTIEDYLRNRLG
ncbi:MAG: polyhydroxyalkanoic acid system family protein [Gammaproteobacteria bacterium]|nr:polyhydroxyalkanoic acid system family protein [Gammaproteobacteria bacterium]